MVTEGELFIVLEQKSALNPGLCASIRWEYQEGGLQQSRVLCHGLRCYLVPFLVWGLEGEGDMLLLCLRRSVSQKVSHDSHEDDRSDTEIN